MADYRKWFVRLTAVAVLLSVLVVLLGAYTRLAEAGLGCPDWPGCYGQIMVPQGEKAVQQAVAAYPEIPLESAKAWKEMVHRYAAGSLGMLIFVLSGLAWRRRKALGKGALYLPLALVVLVIFQAALGMWTVTWRLHPLVVMGHLLGGMSIATGLWLWHFRERCDDISCTHSGELSHHVADDKGTERSLLPWSIVLLLCVIFQIILGGWTSANYASAVCFDFPTCRGEWWPQGHWGEVFDVFKPIGANYAGGVMSLGARMALQTLHRYWGLFTYVLVMGWSMTLMLAAQSVSLKKLGLVMMLLASLQVLLGILNVLLHLPMTIAVMHNGVALLLLMSAATGVLMLACSRSKP